jgi:hypothetical protein
MSIPNIRGNSPNETSFFFTVPTYLPFLYSNRAEQPEHEKRICLSSGILILPSQCGQIIIVVFILHMKSFKEEVQICSKYCQNYITRY